MRDHVNVCHVSMLCFVQACGMCMYGMVCAQNCPAVLICECSMGWSGV